LSIKLFAWGCNWTIQVIYWDRGVQLLALQLYLIGIRSRSLKPKYADKLLRPRCPTFDHATLLDRNKIKISETDICRQQVLRLYFFMKEVFIDVEFGCTICFQIDAKCSTWRVHCNCPSKGNSGMYNWCRVFRMNWSSCFVWRWICYGISSMTQICILWMDWSN